MVATWLKAPAVWCDPWPGHMVVNTSASHNVHTTQNKQYHIAIDLSCGSL